MNGGDKPVDYQLYMNGKAAKANSLPHSISTLVFQSF
jgi:hypothetical protein